MKIFTVTKKAFIFYSVLLITCLTVCLSIGNKTKAVFSETQARLLPIYCVDRGDEKVCAITFDAAWDDSDTDKLIEILDKYNAKATFFIVGDWAEKYPQSVKKFFESGHQIGNHSDTHPHIDGLSEQKILQEIKACDDKIETITGVRPTIFRGPYGEYNNTVITAAQNAGHKVIQWNIDSLDWKKLSSEQIEDRVRKRISPGSIMLFHNGVENTPDALIKILDHLTKEGYKFVTVSELIYEDHYTIDHAGKQIKNGA